MYVVVVVVAVSCVL